MSVCGKSCLQDLLTCYLLHILNVEYVCFNLISYYRLLPVLHHCVVRVTWLVQEATGIDHSVQSRGRQETLAKELLTLLPVDEVMTPTSHNPCV